MNTYTRKQIDTCNPLYAKIDPPGRDFLKQLQKAGDRTTIVFSAPEAARCMSRTKLPPGRKSQACLQGSYAYVNNNSGVASFGPMIFDGEGGLTLKDKVNLPCSDPSPASGCASQVSLK
jgi:hypothetical protein